MYTQISSKKRLTALLVAFAFLLGTFAVGTETVQAASKLKVSPTRKTVYVGSKVTIKANKKVKWSVSGKKKIVKITSKKSKKNKKVTVKAYKAGTAYVKAKYKRQRKSASPFAARFRQRSMWSARRPESVWAITAPLR